MSVRYRLARRLLGYAPLRLPDKDGAYIVWKAGAFTATIATSSLSLTMENSLRSFEELEADIYAYRPNGPTGTFSGTIGEQSAASAAAKLEPVAE